MGTGKTFIAASAAYMAGFERMLVLCPPHLTRKWKREVEETVPGARAVIVASITDLERLRVSAGTGPLFAIMSRERAKLSYRWQPAVVQRWATTARGLVRHEETGEPFQVPCCPDCHAQVVDKDGVPLLGRDLARRKRWCPECGSALWQADRSGPKRFPLADYVKLRLRGFFDLLVGDEVHEYKGRGSAQGIAAGILADACGKSLSLSGTLMGGYSIVAGEAGEESVKDVFAQAQQVAAEAEALLVDAEWAAPEPVVAEVHANGNGHTALPVGGSADDETPERQRSLFSWAEFMAGEPEQPRQRTRRPEPASISLFEWELEREREEELAGVER